MSVSFPLPDLEWEATREFWRAAQRQELAVPRCSACGHYNWYPPESCSACGGLDLQWTAVSGRGSLYSWAVVRKPLVGVFASKVPYITGLVSLAEAPHVRIVTNVVDCDPESLLVELPLRVVFRRLEFPDVPETVMAPMFAPGPESPTESPTDRSRRPA